MECSCSIDVKDYSGTWKRYHEDIRTARKPHKCSECQRTILPGEKYEDFRGLNDDIDKWQKYKTCSDCLSLRSAFFHSYFYEFLWESWWDEMDACGWEVPEKCLAALTPVARARACEKIEMAWRRNGAIMRMMNDENQNRQRRKPLD